MNCLELRRAALTDPHRLGAQATAHTQSCHACSAFLVETMAFENRLDDTLRVPVPHGLKDRALQHAAGTPRFSRRHTIAAGIALALGAGTALLWRRNDPLALAGIDFVVFEEAQAILDAKPTDPADLQRAAVEVGIKLPGQLGELRYIGTCPFGGATAHHVVLKTAYGKATLLLLPGRMLASRGAAAGHGLEAVVAPAAGGSVAIIADSSRGLARIEEFLQSG